MRKQVIPKGQNSVRIKDGFWIPRRNKDFTLTGRMDGLGLFYDHGGRDNSDWNKFAGVYFDLFNPHGRTFMLVWRRVQGQRLNEWTFYYHNIYQNELPAKKVGAMPGYVTEKHLLVLPINKVPKLDFQIITNNTIQVQIEYDTHRIMDRAEFEKPFGKWHTRGNVYFGGNRTPPGKIKVWKKYS